MGFLSRLLRGQSSESKNPQGITIEGLGTYPVQIVGESYYQESLTKIYGGTKDSIVEVIKEATLIHDNHNKYDSEAIRVEIAGMIVGYMSRTSAHSYREYMRNNGKAGKNLICKAKIIGGCSSVNLLGSKYIGVSLDIPVGFLQPVNANPQNTNNQAVNNDYQEIVFELHNCPKEDLGLCKTGDSVSLWMPRDGRQQINIYRRGSLGGQGRLGLIPDKNLNVISKHLSQNLAYDAEILEISIPKSSCKIKFTPISKQETEAKQEKYLTEERNKLSAELQKKYSPRKSLTIKLNLPKTHALGQGQELYIEKQPIEYYVQNVPNRQINFIDKNGIIIAQKKNEPNLIMSVLRAYFSQCDMRIIIDSIETPDKFTLKYLESIPATAIVFFDNKANLKEDK